MNQKKYQYITIWSEEADPDIIFGSYAPKLEIDIMIARQLIEERLDYTHGKSTYLLIDFTNVRSVTKEARDFMNSPTGGLKGILGGAFLSNNVVTTLFVNLYLKVSHPVVPAKFFTSKTEALSWLKAIQLQNTLFNKVA